MAKSPYDLAIEEVQAGIRFARESALKSKAIKVGYEEVSKRDMRSAFMNMAPEQKKQWIQENSLDAAVDLVRPPGGDAPIRGPEELGAGTQPKPPLPLGGLA